MRTRNYNFDIDKHSLIKPVVIIRSGDHDIDTIRVTLSNQGDPVDLTNATVKFMGTTPAGNKIIDDVHSKIVDAASGIFEYTFPSAAGSSVGEYQDAYFSIILGNGQTSTMNFRIQVLSGVDISAPAASDYVSQYNMMVSNLNSAYDSATKATNQKMASTVSSLATSAATVLDSALARVNTVNSTADNASSAASNAVSMASSVASTVTSQASYINSVASSAASNVSSVAASVVDKLNNISLGGRNLLVGSRNFDGEGWYVVGNITSSDFQGFSSVSGTHEWSGPKYYNATLEKQGKIISTNTQYVLSAWVNNTGTTPVDVNFYSNDVEPKSYLVKTLPANSGWVRIASKPFNYTKKTGLTETIRFENVQEVQGGVLKQVGYKLEEGNVPTDWTPAPEDTVSATTRGQILDGADLNNYTTTYKYVINGANNLVNYPSGANNYATLEVEKINTTTSTQKLTDFNKNVFIRSAGGNSGIWSPWIEQANDADVVHKTGNETMTGGLKGGQVNLPAAGDLNTLTDTGKYYLTTSVNAANWANRPSNAPSLAFSVDVIGQANQSLATQVYFVHQSSRMWVRTMWLVNGTTLATSPWAELADDANVMHKTGNETAAGDKTFTGKVSVSGELDAAQKIYTRTIGSTNDLQLAYTRVGNLVTGRYRVKLAGTFPLGGNDGYKSNMGESVNVIAAGGVDAWFTNDNKFVAKGASEGNFVFVTRDPLPSN